MRVDTSAYKSRFRIGLAVMGNARPLIGPHGIVTVLGLPALTRKLMEAWASFCNLAENVIPLAQRVVASR